MGLLRAVNKAGMGNSGSLVSNHCGSSQEAEAHCCLCYIEAGNSGWHVRDQTSRNIHRI